MHLEVYAFDSSFNTESIKPNQLKNDSSLFLPPKNSHHNEVYFSLFLQPTSYVFTVRFGSLRYLSFSDFAEMCDRLTMTKKGCHEWPPVTVATYFFCCRVICTSQRRCSSNTSRCLQPSHHRRPSPGRHVLSTTARMGLWENIEYYGSWGVRGVHFERASKQAIGEGSLLYMGNSLCLVKTGPLSVLSLRINVKKNPVSLAGEILPTFLWWEAVSAPMAHHTNVCEFGHLVDAICNLFI